MKYTIEGFSQEKAIELGLDLEDLLILRWIVDFSPKMSKQVIEGKEYFWVKYQALLQDIPILNFKSKDRLYRKMKSLVNKNILLHKNIKNTNGNFSYYAIGDSYSLLIGEDNIPYVKNTVTLR